MTMEKPTVLLMTEIGQNLPTAYQAAVRQVLLLAVQYCFLLTKARLSTSQERFLPDVHIKYDTEIIRSTTDYASSIAH